MKPNTNFQDIALEIIFDAIEKKQTSGDLG